MLDTALGVCGLDGFCFGERLERGGERCKEKRIWKEIESGERYEWGRVLSDEVFLGVGAAVGEACGDDVDAGGEGGEVGGA